MQRFVTAGWVGVGDWMTVTRVKKGEVLNQNDDREHLFL